MRWSSLKTVAAFALLCGMVIIPAFYDEIAQALGATVEAAVAKKPVQGCNHPGHECARSFRMYANDLGKPPFESTEGYPNRHLHFCGTR
jgi:hypothetical protein